MNEIHPYMMSTVIIYTSNTFHVLFASLWRNYIITNLGEVTPLALDKLLAFSNGINYALNGKQLIYDESQAWAHGPVYPYIYYKYKKYGYKPIDNGIYSSHGWMTSKLSKEEIETIDMVIRTFGLYSPIFPLS